MRELRAEQWSSLSELTGRCGALVNTLAVKLNERRSQLNSLSVPAELCKELYESVSVHEQCVLELLWRELSEPPNE